MVFFFFVLNATIKTFESILPTGLPAKITAFNWYFPWLYNILEVTDIGIKPSFGNGGLDMMEQLEMMMEKKYGKFKYPLFFRSGLTQGLTAILFCAASARNKHLQTQTTNEVFLEIIRVYNLCSVAKLKMNFYEARLKILKFILKKMRQSKKFTKDYMDLRIESMTHETTQKLHQANTEYQQYKDLYYILTNNETNHDILIFQPGLEEIIQDAIKQNAYLKLLRRQRFSEIINQFNFTLQGEYDIKKKQASIFLNLSIHKSDAPKKNKLIAMQYLEKLEQTYPVFLADLQEISKNIEEVFKILLNTLDSLVFVRQKYDLSNQNFIKILNDVFFQMDNVLENIEKLMKKQEEIIDLFGATYLQRASVEPLKQDPFSEIVEKIMVFIENQEKTDTI